MKSLLLLLLRGYQLGISPFLGQNCRFYPSCSRYAVQAIQEYGAWKGGVLTAKRLCKCHPWHPGGSDPVPGKKREPEFSSTAARGCGHPDF
jgi:putative membrane protein insertion efficiency factor